MKKINFSKIKRDIDRAISHCKRTGGKTPFFLPYKDSAEQIQSDAILKELRDRGLLVQIHHTDTVMHGNIFI